MDIWILYFVSGIAAGLQPMTIPVGSGSPYPNPGKQI